MSTSGGTAGIPAVHSGEEVKPLHEYEPGTWGPDEADGLMVAGGWTDPS